MEQDTKRDARQRQRQVHQHEWRLWDAFNFDGPVFECRCGLRRLEADWATTPTTGGNSSTPVSPGLAGAFPRR